MEKEGGELMDLTPTQKREIEEWRRRQ